MATVGVICEYNPFHNGHVYQLQQAKSQLGCDTAVCVMSGTFVQRGEVALFDKWARTRAALLHGADVVLELPVYGVLQSAEQFARLGVELLHTLGVVDYLSFGSECGDLTPLKDIAHVLAAQPQPWREALAQALADGMGYPAAMAYAFGVTQPHIPAELLSAPNNMLGAGYLAALEQLGSPIRPHTVARQGAGHDDTALAGAYASGTAIRGAICRGEDVTQALPDGSSYDCRYHTEALASLVLGFLRRAEAAQLDNVPGMEPGLGNRLIACARDAADWGEFVRLGVTKRYTAGRIRRQTLAALLGFAPGARLDYLRVLGCTRAGGALLRRAKAVCPLPIITKTADAKVGADSMLHYDLRATDLGALACDNPEKRRAGADFYTSPMVIER